MRILMSAVLVFYALGAFFMPGCARNTDAPAPQRETGARDSIRVGSVEMEALFHSYSKAGDFYRKAEEIQLRFEELGEDDFEQVMRLQGEFQLAQMEFFQGFQADIEQTARKVAKDLNLDVVAVDVLFSSEKTEIIGVTGNFMETELFGRENPAEHTHSEFCGPECE